MMDKRIISLSPATTEIICALGLQDQLVGRSEDCSPMDAVHHLPICASLSVDAKLIQELNPTILFVDSRHAAELRQLDINAISLQFGTLSDVYTNISIIGQALNEEKKAEELIENSKERVDIILHKLKYSEIKPKVACFTSLSPLAIGNTLLSELIEIAGGSNPLTTNVASTDVGLTEFKLEDPQIMVIMPENYAIQRTLQEFNQLLNIPGWSDLSAVTNNQVYIADSQNVFSSQGMRLFDGLEILAEIIHPKQFVFGYQGTGWIKFNS